MPSGCLDTLRRSLPPPPLPQHTHAHTLNFSILHFLLSPFHLSSTATQIAKPYGLSVRGSGGEHTPVVGHMVDISPSARFGISEAEILSRLFGGIKAMMAEENKMAEAKKAKK